MLCNNSGLNMTQQHATNQEKPVGFVTIKQIAEQQIEVEYRISYLSMSTNHQPACSKLLLPLDFYQKRSHLFFTEPYVSNHDPLSLHLLNRSLDEIDKDEITLVEFGVWRGASLENIAIHAEETNKKLIIWGFDSFDGFPDSAIDKDLRTRTVDTHNETISSNYPYSKKQIQDILAKYSSIKELNLVSGDILKLKLDQQIQADYIYFDMDYYATFVAAMPLISNINETKIIVDDYYQPSWVGMVDAVNEFCEANGLYPVNLSDYFRVERSHRTQFMVTLLPLQAKTK
jgi:hypothetical protein